MIGTSTGELVFIRLSVLVLRYMPIIYVAALICCVSLQKRSPIFGLGSIVLSVLLLAELLFFTSIYAPHKRRLRNPAHHTIMPLGERKNLFKKCIENTSQPEKYLRGWFLGADMEDIREDNLREFFLWAFFDIDMHNRDPSTIDGTIQDELDEYVGWTEQLLGRPVGEGRGPAKSFRLTFDDIPSAYRCLLWYFIVFLVDTATHFVLRWHGFHFYARSPRVSLRTFPPRPLELFARYRSPVPELGYWFRPHHSQSKRPMVFWHGIGIGLWTYVWFLIQLSTATGDMGFIVPEFLPISFRLTDPPPPKDVLLQMIVKVIDHHDWDTFKLVSHSYGSVLTTHMLHSPLITGRISAVVLIDPVTILLHLPDVAYNFTRRPPKRANEWQLWYYASTDLGVAYCLGRHFFWRDNIMWKEDLLMCRDRLAIQDTHPDECQIAIFLSGRDLIVDTAAVCSYLTSHPQVITGTGPGNDTEGDIEHRSNGMDVVFIPHLDHAQVFDVKYARDRIVQLIQ